MYVIEFENRDNYRIVNFKTEEEAQKYIEDNNLDEYPNVPIIMKSLPV